MKNISIALNQYSSLVMQLENEDENILVGRSNNSLYSSKGLVGGEYLLVGIGGCFSSALLSAAQSSNIKIIGLKVEVTAKISVSLKRLNKINLTISYGYCSSPNEFEKLLKVAEKGCISINTLKHKPLISIKSTTPKIEKPVISIPTT